MKRFAKRSKFFITHYTSNDKILIEGKPEVSIENVEPTILTRTIMITGLYVMAFLILTTFMALI